MHPNLRQDPDNIGKAVLTSESDCIDEHMLQLPTVNPMDSICQKFVHMINGSPHKAEVIEELEDNKFLVQIADGGREESLTYNDILDGMDAENNPQDNDPFQLFKSVLDHGKNNKGR